MRFSLRKAWLVAGAAMMATACSGRVQAPSGMEAAVPNPAPAVEVLESPGPTEAALRAPATATAPPLVEAGNRTAGIPDPTGSPAATAVLSSTESMPTAIGPETTSTVSSEMTRAQQQLLASLPNRGPAPELANEIWLNTKPLRLAELRGKVVLLDMWTYG